MYMYILTSWGVIIEAGVSSFVLSLNILDFKMSM